MSKQNAALQEYWEQQLKIDYNAELEYYKKLCGYKYNNNLLKKSDVETEHISYARWKKQIMEPIELCNVNQLKEYSRYLEQKYRDNETIFGMTQSLLIPFILAILSFISGLIVEIVLQVEKNGMSALLALVVFAIFLIFIFAKLFSTKEEAIRKYFYQDIKEIVDERINLIKTNKAEKQQ